MINGKLYYNQQAPLVVDNQYRNQLRDMLSAAPMTFLKIKKLPYRQNSLLNLLKDYHKEMNVNYSLKIAPNPAHIGFLGGFSNHKIKFLEPATNEIYLIDFQPVFSPTFGIAREKYFNSRRQTGSFVSELAWTGFKTQEKLLSPTDIKAGIAPNLVREWQANFSIQHLKLTGLFRHKFNLVKNEVKPFINIGLAYGISLKHKQVILVRTGGTTTTNEFQAREKLSIVGGFGAKYKALGIDFRYEYSKVRMTKILLLNQVNSFTMQFTYWFK